MMHWILVFSDLVSALFGILGAVILGYPLITDVVDRRQWELLKRFKNEVLAQPGSARDEDIEAHREIRDRLIDIRLGQYADYRRITIWGFVCLLAAFVFMLFASIDRIGSHLGAAGSGEKTAASRLEK